MDNRAEVAAREQFGAVRVQNMLAPTYRLMIRGQRVCELTRDELDSLALGLAFALSAMDPEVVHGPTGVELSYHDGAAHVHLCHSEFAEDFAAAVMTASGLDEAVKA